MERLALTDPALVALFAVVGDEGSLALPAKADERLAALEGEGEFIGVGRRGATAGYFPDDLHSRIVA